MNCRTVAHKARRESKINKTLWASLYKVIKDAKRAARTLAVCNISQIMYLNFLIDFIKISFDKLFLSMTN